MITEDLGELGASSDGKNKMTIAAVILTKNEEHRIRRCLDSLRPWVDEIIVIDDESTDRTRDIVREYGGRVVVHSLDDDFAAQRNRGIAAAQSEWILQLDADEAVPEESVAIIRAALAQPGPCNGFEILRKDCVFDRPLAYRGSCYQIRILRKGAGTNQGAIHEEVVIEGEVGRIATHILHYNLDSVHSAIAKNNFYTELECARFLADHPAVPYSEIKRRLIYKPVSLFYKHYIKNKAYKDGPRGLVRAMLNTLHPVMLWLKILERQIKDGNLENERTAKQ